MERSNTIAYRKKGKVWAQRSRNYSPNELIAKHERLRTLNDEELVSYDPTAKF